MTVTQKCSNTLIILDERNSYLKIATEIKEINTKLNKVYSILGRDESTKIKYFTFDTIIFNISVTMKKSNISMYPKNGVD